MSIAVMRHALDIAGSAMKDAIKFIDDMKAENASLRKAISELEQRSITEAQKQERQCENCGEFGICCQQHQIPLMQEGKDFTISKPWVGLTYEERHEIREWQKIQEELGPVWAPMMLYLYEAIEAKLKEKNT